MSLENAEVLITGGCGYLGKSLTKKLISEHKVKGIRLYSRNEENQRIFHNELKNLNLHKNVAFLIGDVRDRDRLELAMKNIDVVIHAASMKQIPTCSENPRDCVYTNIIGSQNVIDCSIKNNIRKSMFVSTDKASSPSTLYGATKMVSEQLFINGNIYSGGRNPYFSCVRYGNILGSTGSVIPLFKKQYKEKKEITITDKRSTRFWWTIEQASKFVLNSIEKMKGKEIFVPKIGSSSLMELANIIAPEAKIKEIGIRANEKIHEELLSIEESRNVEEFENYYVIWPNSTGHKEFVYSSNNNPYKLTKEELKSLVKSC